MLTLEQFKASKVFYPHGFPQMDIEGPVWIYDLCCQILVMSDGGFLLVIFNEQWVNSDIAELEEILYKEFYVPECTS